MENYEVLGTIGEGTYGIVLKARHKETGQIVAIKKFKESDEDEQVRKTALREVRILKQLKHDNIVNLIEVFRRKGKLHLVFEFVERTILEDLERNPDGMDPLECKKCLWQLLRSIEYCHSHNVIHRDIKPENLLISRNGTLKLCDFGFARTLAGPGARYTDYVATRWYRGPELLTGDTQYGKPVDVWAIGCMLPEMASGAPLFPGESDIDQLFHIMRCFGQLPPKLLEVFKSNPLFVGIKIPEVVQCTETLEKRFTAYPKDQLNFMKQCLKYEPEHRCTCSELMQHPYFTEDGFVAWFDGELKQMLERDAQDFKMRQKKYRKSVRNSERNSDRNAPAAPQSQSQLPPSHHTSHGSQLPPHHSYGCAPHQHHGHAPMYQPHEEEDQYVPGGAGNIQFPTGHGAGGRRFDSDLEPVEVERRPATRGSDYGTHSRKEDYGGGHSHSHRKEEAAELGLSSEGGEMPLLPNLNRPTTPRAQRLVAFPQLSSAVEESSGHGPPPPMPQARGMWGNPPMASHSSHGGKGKSRGDFDMPSMPQLPTSLASQRSDAGSSNLPQLREDISSRLPFGVDEPGRGMPGMSHYHAPLAAPAPQPPRTGGGGKKKASAYDPNNPYASKPPGKSKGKKASSISSHGCHGVGPSSSSQMRGEMGIFGQGQSIAGLAAAYALPPTIPPRTPNHDLHGQDASMLFGLEGHSASHGYQAGPSSVQGVSGFNPPLQLGSHLHGSKLQSSSNYGGGQYAKYGKRF